MKLKHRELASHYKKVPKKLHKAVSYKIRHFINEGYSQKRAVAAAVRMALSGKLGPRGGKKRKNPSQKERNTVVYYVDQPSLGNTKSSTYDQIVTQLKNWKIPRLENIFGSTVKGYSTVHIMGVLKGKQAAMFVQAFSRDDMSEVVDGLQDEFFPTTQSNPIADKDVWECYAALSGLLKFPERSEDVEEHILDALEAEGLWNYEDGVTKAGKEFLENAAIDRDDD